MEIGKHIRLFSALFGTLVTVALASGCAGPSSDSADATGPDELASADAVLDSSVPGDDAAQDASAGPDGATDVVAADGTPPEAADLVQEELIGPDAADAVAALPTGATCVEDDDCAFGPCLDTDNGMMVCSGDCAAGCPEDWSCGIWAPEGSDAQSVCAPAQAALCRPCRADDECRRWGIDTGDRCVSLGPGGAFCGGACGGGEACPDGYACGAWTSVDGAAALLCLPEGDGECGCDDASEGATTDCWVESDHGVCAGERGCEDGALTACSAATPEAETCNGLDDDCDGETDEGLGTLDCGIGACAVSVPACVDGAPQTCVPLDLATDETCNGLDDDCDGETDEDLLPLSCGLGICENTVPACVEGAPQDCVPLDVATDEACNGLDDDCDGGTDEEIVGIGDACAVENDHGSCPGAWACQDGAQLCDGPTPEAEDCDGLDDDCDGETDEGLPALACGLGPCQHAVPACLDGVPQECDPLEGATEEVCNGADDDCDGVADDGLWGVPCQRENEHGICDGTSYCLYGQALCDAPVPATEVCDGLDNDCSGLADDGIPDLSCGVGACEQTVPACLDGVPQTCDPFAGWSPELCNGEDDDCDGADDDGLGSTTCGEGICQVTVENCFDGAAQDCVPLDVATDEVCNGLDDDCNGAIDEDLGATTCGLGPCEVTVENCLDGIPQGCVPLDVATDEVCNGLDDDCDGAEDEEIPDLSCGLGLCEKTVPACLGGVPQLCDAFAELSVEVCDGADNDCDGQVDEGFHDGGDGACLPAGHCSEGYHDGGDGSCWPVAVPWEACAPSFWITEAGDCVVFQWDEDCAPGADAAPFKGGAGTPEDPWQVCDCAMLQAMDLDPSAHYVLTGDIDCDVPPFDGGEGFYPVAEEDGFTGTLDGAGHGVFWMIIDRPDMWDVGLFSWIDVGGRVEHLRLVDGHVTGNLETGLLAGYSAGVIEHVTASGAVTGLDDRVGGLVGRNQWGELRHCHASVSVTGSAWGNGGLVGRNEEGLVERCAASGDVDGGDDPGGLVGWNEAGTVQDCYATGTVTSGNDGGGLNGGGTGVLQRAYATGDVTAASFAGGMIGGNWAWEGLYGEIHDTFALGLPVAADYVGGIAAFSEGPKVFGSVYLTHPDGPAQCFMRECIYFFSIQDCLDHPVCAPHPEWGCAGDWHGPGDEGCASVDDPAYFHDPSNAPMDAWDFETVWREVPGRLPALRWEACPWEDVGQPELCNGRDDDCDGAADEYLDCPDPHLYVADMAWHEAEACATLGGHWGGGNRCWFSPPPDAVEVALASAPGASDSSEVLLTPHPMDAGDEAVCAAVGCALQGDGSSCACPGGAFRRLQMNASSAGPCVLLGGTWGGLSRCWTGDAPVYRLDMAPGDNDTCAAMEGLLDATGSCWTLRGDCLVAQMGSQDAPICAAVGGHWAADSRCWKLRWPE